MALPAPPFTAATGFGDIAQHITNGANVVQWSTSGHRSVFQGQDHHYWDPGRPWFRDVRRSVHHIGRWTLRLVSVTQPPCDLVSARAC